MAVNNNPASPSVWTKVQSVAAVVQKVTSAVDSAIGALDSVQNAISKFHFVSPDFSNFAGQLRIVKVINLPFKIKNIFFEAVKVANNEDSQERVVSVATIVATLGDIVDDISTVIDALDKLTKVAATVNAVAKWLGFAGAVVSAAITVPIESYFINKGVSVLKDLENHRHDALDAEAFRTNVLALSILEQEQVDKMAQDTGKVGLVNNLKKRVHFDISMRAIAITLAILTVVAVCIATFGVGAVVIAVGATISAALAVTSLLLIPVKVIAKNEFDKEFEEIVG